MWLMYSTADSKRSATDSKLFAGDILPKTQAQWKKTFSISAQKEVRNINLAAPV